MLEHGGVLGSQNRFTQHVGGRSASVLVVFGGGAGVFWHQNASVGVVGVHDVLKLFSREQLSSLRDHRVDDVNEH